MHDRYREKGVPESVEFVTAEVSSLPFNDDHLDGAYSTMTYHEYAPTTSGGAETASDDRGSIDELARVIRPGGRLVTVDWSANGDPEIGPPSRNGSDSTKRRPSSRTPASTLSWPLTDRRLSRSSRRADDNICTIGQYVIEFGHFWLPNRDKTICT